MTLLCSAHTQQRVPCAVRTCCDVRVLWALCARFVLCCAHSVYALCCAVCVLWAPCAELWCYSVALVVSKQKCLNGQRKQAQAGSMCTDTG